MNDDIVLDRENLLKLIRAVQRPPSIRFNSVEFREGYAMALAVIERIARSMPTVQPAIPPATALNKWQDHRALCKACSDEGICSEGQELVAAVMHEEIEEA